MIARREFLIGGVATVTAASVPAFGQGAGRLEFLSNPLADYLHLLFFRFPKDSFPVFAPAGFADAPKLNELVAVPEAVASARLDKYEQLHSFVAEAFAALPARQITQPRPKLLSYSDTPPKLQEVLSVIAGGAKFFDEFLIYWHQYVRPQVTAQIDAWDEQAVKHKPLELLQEFHRLPLRSDKLQAVAMPFHPAGSANYSPAAVYTSLFKKPNLPWLLGHEGSHLLWSAAVGTDWRQHSQAQQAIKLAAPHRVDVEEAVCSFMQVEMSKACGLSPSDYSSAKRVEEGPTKRLLLALEANWSNYRSNPHRWPTLIDYVLEATSKTFE